MTKTFVEMYPSQSANIAARTLGDDTIIMSTQDATVFMLNSVATVIWNAADGKTPLSQIVRDRVCSAFDVSDAEAYADAKELVMELSERGILRVFDVPVSLQEAQ